MSEFLDKAITAHLAWKGRLRAALDNPGSLDEKTIVLDNACELGKWIEGDGKKYQDLPDFQILKKKHTEFHRLTASVVVLMKSGKKIEALDEIDNGMYATKSNEVINAIAQLRKSAPMLNG
jgi:hypothetical protein